MDNLIKQVSDVGVPASTRFETTLLLDVSQVEGELPESLDTEELLKLDQQLQDICQKLLAISSKTSNQECGVGPSSPHHSVNVDQVDDETEDYPLLPEDNTSCSTPPPDGGWGWVVVASTFYVNFMLAGLLRSYGVLLTAIAGEFPEASTALVAWVPGVMGTATLVLSPLSSVLCERFTCRQVVFTGGLLAAVGTGLCYFLYSVPFLILTGGLLTGVGFTFCITPCLVIVGLYFCRHRALANSLNSAGSAAGGLVMPHVIRGSLDAIDLAWTFLLLGGLMFTMSLAALFLTPLSDKKSKRNRQEIKPKSSRLEVICRTFSLDLFCHPVFVVLALSAVFMSAGSPHVLYFLPAYAEGLGLSLFNSSSLLSYAAFGDLSGRVIFGWASDKQFVPRRVEYACSITLAALVVLALPAMNTFISLATFSIFYGAATGSWQCLIPVLLADYHGTSQLGGAISLVRMLQGLTNLAIPPLTGYLRDLHGHFISSFYMMGGVMALSAVVALSLPLAETLHKKRLKKLINEST